MRQVAHLCSATAQTEGTGVEHRKENGGGQVCQVEKGLTGCDLRSLGKDLGFYFRSNGEVLGARARERHGVVCFKRTHRL